MKLTYSLNINDIQLNILTELNTSTEEIRFSELNVDNLTNDKFNYHLKYLLDRGYVQKGKSGYSITFRGKKLMSDIDLKGKKYDMFRFSVTVNVFKVVNGKKYVLVQKRKRYPYIDDITTIAGKVKKGEFVKDAAIRKFKEETGLIISDVKVLGILRKIRVDDSDKVIEDVVYSVCYAENPKGELIEHSEWGDHWWCEVGEFLDIQSKNIDIGEYDRECIERMREEKFETFYFEQRSVIRDY
jgi:8-oxo-dGTP pyrophosphatase MutT (NUDIX family)